jgi:hypothetical protein
MIEFKEVKEYEQESINQLTLINENIQSNNSSLKEIIENNNIVENQIIERVI